MIKNKYINIASIMMLSVLLSITIVSCKKNDTNSLNILSGSENETLEPLLKKFSEDNKIKVTMQYKGSVDIMNELMKADTEFDAVWPAGSIWITLGDKNHKVKNSKSIFTSPVVFGIRKSVAQGLGFVDKPIKVSDILSAIENNKLKFIMTSAIQSNSGASAYFGFTNALLGSPDTISVSDLSKPDFQNKISTFLSGINRSSGSSGWLKDLFLKGGYDSMVNYESLIIETNQQLIKEGKEPLYLIYPQDGLAIADSPLGYVNHNSLDKEMSFKKLQAYLLSQNVQNELLKLGRRTGFGGDMLTADKSVFNPDWGIDTKKILSPINFPSADVIKEALNLYQTKFRKPSLTVFCLDYSGSMEGSRIEDLKKSMQLLLTPETAKENMLSMTKQDIIYVIPFNGEPLEVWSAKGDNPPAIAELLQKIVDLKPYDGTDIYSPVIRAIERISSQLKLEQYVSSVVLMTDGQSNQGKTYKDFEAYWKKINKDIPVFSIVFGDASEEQLKQIEVLTKSKVFDGKKDLVSAFKNVRGYN